MKITGTETLEGVVISEVIPLQSEQRDDGETPQSYEVQREIHPYDWFALRRGGGVVINHNRRLGLLHKYLHDEKIPNADIREPIKYKSQFPPN